MLEFLAVLPSILLPLCSIEHFDLLIAYLRWTHPHYGQDDHSDRLLKLGVKERIQDLRKETRLRQ
jgi:hypothetical protein